MSSTVFLALCQTIKKNPMLSIQACDQMEKIETDRMIETEKSIQNYAKSMQGLSDTMYQVRAVHDENERFSTVFVSFFRRLYKNCTRFESHRAMISLAKQNPTFKPQKSKS